MFCFFSALADYLSLTSTFPLAVILFALILVKEDNVFRWYVFFFSFRRCEMCRFLCSISTIVIIVTFKHIHLRTRFVSSCFLILPSRFSINNFSSRKLSGYLSCNFSLNSICVYSTTFCDSAIAVLNAFHYHIKLNFIDS